MLPYLEPNGMLENQGILICQINLEVIKTNNFLLLVKNTSEIKKFTRL